MSLQIPLFRPNFIPKFHPNLFPSPISLTNNTSKPNFSCKSSTNGGELAAELASELAKLKAISIQREEAMVKSTELLFKEFCVYVGLEANEVKQRWREMGDEDKLIWSKGFVSEWGQSFHPLSSKSVKTMVEEHLGGVKTTPLSAISSTSTSSSMFPSLKKLMGLS
ncbi:hypothetical protein GIB67_010844 [Kingdonia uniflora]|uniref:DUF7026 domain-containing protein n=1 Tax=Kingdonia uniflora TaxID=39325 RepID=A0A7J7PAF3_9MAGN|nr:hypothetical protein GIB67_010844 [Kingdonia uniflora]